MPNAAQQHYSWNTKDELEFIACLAADATRQANSPALLQRYVLALRKRTNWRGLDREAIAADLAARGCPL